MVSGSLHAGMMHHSRVCYWVLLSCCALASLTLMAALIALAAVFPSLPMHAAQTSDTANLQVGHRVGLLSASSNSPQGALMAASYISIQTSLYTPL